MIESISIAGIATYGDEPEIMSGLKQVNYIFGSNGTGKTTIGRILADRAYSERSTVTWQDGELKSMVYNRDFVKKNFSASGQVPGVFTLGEDQIAIREKIAAVKIAIEDIDKDVQCLESDKKRVKEKQDRLRDELEKAFWAEKSKFSISKLNRAFDGFQGSKSKFKDKVLEASNADSNTEITLAELEEKSKTVYGADLRQEQPMAPFDAQALISYESDAILKKKIVGSTDCDISAMIAKLKNSDWVRAGKKFHDENNGSCPFCQQSTPESLARELNNYFDQSFESDIQELAVLASSYQFMSAQLTAQIAKADEQIRNSTVSDANELSRQLELHKMTFASSVQKNINLIAGKQGAPSQSFELIPIETVVAGISKTFQDFNDSAARRNLVLNNISSEKETLAAQVWSYVAESLRSGIEDFRAGEEDLKEEITSIEAKVAANQKKEAGSNKTLQELEKSITSINPTKDAINKLLTSLGYQGFSLQDAGDNKSYKLVRSDGSDVKETLSEGEQTFVSFLYFYYLLKGGATETDTTKNRVVVFDDPVSSLNNDVLSIVVSLIRDLSKNIRD